MLNFLYVLTLAGGVYYTFYLGSLNQYVIGATIIASWAAGFNAGEFIEKCQHMWHLWNSPLGGGNNQHQSNTNSTNHSSKESHT